MKINHEDKNRGISDTLVNLLGKNINLAHIKLISLFIMALYTAKTVCFSLLATVFDSPAKAESCLRRIQRFFAEFDLSQDLIASFLYRLLPGTGRRTLAIDRTNWQFGQTVINIFMLAVTHEGVAYPLMFTMLPKRGNSNTQERIALLQRYVSLFGTDRTGKMLLLVMIAFVWCYDVGEYVHRNIKEITVKTHGRKAKSIFRYGLDIVTEFLVRARYDHGIPINYVMY